MLSDVHYESLSGTNVYWDFVELPSKLLENWAEEKEWLSGVAMHYKTRERMADEMLDNMVESKNFISGFRTVRQLGFCFADMFWHTQDKPYKGDIIECEQRAMSSARIFPVVEGIAMSPSFSHIFSGGYAAGYYSYKWAEVLDADAFSLFKERGIFDKETASLFREHILSKGGTEHPMQLYVRFRGHEPSIGPLLERNGLTGGL
jgi:peptidyl-dipeptidase Dcp